MPTVITENNVFHGYADAAYANADDQKSTSRYIFLSAGGAISWRSKKQMMIALSSMEAEYVALSVMTILAAMIRTLIFFFFCSYLPTPILTFPLSPISCTST